MPAHHSTPLHSTPLHSTPLHSAALSHAHSPLHSLLIPSPFPPLSTALLHCPPLHPTPPRGPRSAVIKWLQPRVGGIEPEACSNATFTTYGRTLIVFGGVTGAPKPGSDTPPYTDQLLSMHIEKMRWEAPKVGGAHKPSARGGCVSCLNGNRLLIYGGEVEANGPPSDELWALDLETATWTNCGIRGVSPGKLSYGAAACVGNKAYFFGGWTGEEASNGLYTLDAVSLMWEPLEDNASGPRPTPRWGHSLVAVEDKVRERGGGGDS